MTEVGIGDGLPAHLFGVCRAEDFVEGVVRGSCLCGGVRFEVRPPFIRASHCHCELAGVG
jgi:hypothetical protein